MLILKFNASQPIQFDDLNVHIPSQIENSLNVSWKDTKFRSLSKEDRMQLFTIYANLDACETGMFPSTIPEKRNLRLHLNKLENLSERTLVAKLRLRGLDDSKAKKDVLINRLKDSHSIKMMKVVICNQGCKINGYQERWLMQCKHCEQYYQ
eukprot:420304_1